MNKNIMIVMGGAFVFAILVALLVQFALGGKKEEPVKEVKKKEPLAILVASKDLAIGHKLMDGDMRWMEWPESTALFKGAIKRKSGDESADGVLEGRLSRAVSEGEPMMKSVILVAKGNFVAASLEPGQRAVAVEVSAATMAGGFVTPGDFVDVILTYKSRMYAINEDDVLAETVISRNLDKLATETILQNIKVLAVDQRAKKPDDDKVKVARTVTLAVDARQAEMLALSSEMGDLTLALRGVGDDTVKEKAWLTVSDVRMMQVDDEIVEEYEKIRNDAGITGNIMRIYNGGQVSTVQTQ